MGMEFVEGWDVIQVLGEGAYGEVRLLVNRSTGDSVAMKVLDLERDPHARENIRKEVCIHRMLNHEHIIRFYGQRQHETTQYIFLEYAAGGELFDRIEPDIGMPINEAAKYFRHLILGVEYLHSKGIAHRDLKPENLLLDDKDNLRISDFGMATLFRSAGKERSLEKRCGTKPYLAPEVLTSEYRAEPADLWSCAIILIALLAGELPWDIACKQNPEYCKWKERDYSSSPWPKIIKTKFSWDILKNMLVSVPGKRFTIAKIKAHPFFNQSLKLSDCARKLNGNAFMHKRICSGTELMSDIKREVVTRFSLSQPQMGSECNLVDESDMYCNSGFFSQPVRPEHMLLSSQTETQTNYQTPLQKLVKRMTRFFVKIKAEETKMVLKDVFHKRRYNSKTSSKTLTATTVDRRGIELVFKVNLIDMDNKLLVDFRLSKGDGIEFKRHFMEIKTILNDILIPGPITWPIAIATNTIP